MKSAAVKLPNLTENTTWAGGQEHPEAYGSAGGIHADDFTFGSGPPAAAGD